MTVRKLEDWFKYLEQQYVDERAPQEEKTTTAPPSSPAEPVRMFTEEESVSARPHEPTPVEAQGTPSPSAPPPEQEGAPAEGAFSAPHAVLSQVQVEEFIVPDPVDYIFTLRRHEEDLPSAEMPTSSGEEGQLKQEDTTAPQESATEPAATVAPEPANEQPDSATRLDSEEGSAKPAAPSTPRAKPTKRAPYTRSVKPIPPPQSIEELWQRVPKHVRLLVELGDDEVTQKYYDRRFKESRQELVERLLNPSLTLEDTARLLGVCPTTVRRYTERGLLNHYRTPGNQRRFRLSDVIAFLEARQQAQEARQRKR